ncbi:hypothetical protein GCM10025771_33830 [Niveibacterium umoris]|uniref:Lipase helper protein n=1 Tax=Niveibacterium umoris TaxID=1193620 RepID=A0A840BGU2_9RHOO|nr:lipase secretion chaperone [Niveibacterium umoris]MBB4011424.1 lipase chaperone LimK [Niveibacterium umoris]
MFGRGETSGGIRPDRVPEAAQAVVAEARGEVFPFSRAEPAVGELDTIRAQIVGGVLAGTDPDGAWVCAGPGRLRADHQIRRRIDWYGNQLGRFTPEAIAAAMAQEADEACGRGAGLAARAIWQAYREAQTIDLPSIGRLDAKALAKRLETISAARRRAMGQDWGEAFFGAEERLLAERLSAPPPVSGVPLPLPDADARIAAVEAAWANWAQRISVSKEEIRKLQQDKGLSDAEREAQVNAIVEAHFEPAERLRARTVLGDG